MMDLVLGRAEAESDLIAAKTYKSNKIKIAISTKTIKGVFIKKN
jgi:hypothetical protein